MEETEEILPEDQPAIADALNDLVLVLEKHAIPYILDGGTLLGIIRENRFLPWDNDVGLDVPAELLHPVQGTIKQELALAGFEIDECDDRFENCKINAIKNGARFEIMGWFLRGKYRRRLHYRVPAVHLSETKRVDFMGYRFTIPRAPERYLRFFYGNWRVPKKGSHFYNFRTFDQKVLWGSRLRKLLSKLGLLK